MWSSEPREGLAVRRAKEVPSFLIYFKPLSTAWPRNRTQGPSALSHWHQTFRLVMLLIQVFHYSPKSLLDKRLQSSPIIEL